MINVGRLQKINVTDAEEEIRMCSNIECEREAVFTCHAKVACRQYGCRKDFCEECMGKDKQCACLDQR